MKRSIEERLKELQYRNLSKREMLTALYLEKYPIFEITKVLGINSSELRELSDDLILFLLRCPVGHKLLNNPALHTDDAHYCIECQRWFNDATLKDEIKIEIRRLKEREEPNKH